jgi:hypothetical protein
MVETVGPHRPRGHSDGSNTVRVSKGDDTESSKHGDTRVRPFCLEHQIPDRGENIFFIDAKLFCLLKVVGKDIEEELRVAISVDMAVGIGIEKLPELDSVD